MNRANLLLIVCTLIAIVLSMSRCLSVATLNAASVVKLDSIAHHGYGVPERKSIVFEYREAVPLEVSIALYRRSIAFDPQNAAAWRAMGDAYFWQGDRDRAGEGLRRSVAVGSRSSLLFADLGYLAMLRGDERQQIVWWRRIPRFDETLVYLGGDAQSRNETADARRYYSWAAAVRPSNGRAWLGAGRALALLGRPGEAEGLLATATGRLSAAEGLSLAHAYRADALQLTGRTAEADQSCRDAMSAGPDDALSHFICATIAAANGHRTWARVLAVRACSLNPNNVETLLLASRLAYEAADFSSAYNSCAAAVSVAPTDVRGYECAARVQLARGDASSASSWLARAPLAAARPATIDEFR